MTSVISRHSYAYAFFTSSGCFLFLVFFAEPFRFFAFIWQCATSVSYVHLYVLLALSYRVEHRFRRTIKSLQHDLLRVEWAKLLYIGHGWLGQRDRQSAATNDRRWRTSRIAVAYRQHTETSSDVSTGNEGHLPPDISPAHLSQNSSLFRRCHVHNRTPVFSRGCLLPRVGR